jgi:tetratricopeptide (TPR) repeat protein
VEVAVHFELLRSPEIMPMLGPAADGQPRQMALAELESFTLHQQLSEEVATLCLTTLGMARYSAEDWSEAITALSEALRQPNQSGEVVEETALLVFRGCAYYEKGDLDHTIADFTAVIELWPDSALPYAARGATYYIKGNYDCAIADNTAAIERGLGDAETYLIRGIAYGKKGEIGHAVADLEKAWDLAQDPALKQFIEKGLEAAKRKETATPSP